LNYELVCARVYRQCFSLWQSSSVDFCRLDGAQAMLTGDSIKRKYGRVDFVGLTSLACLLSFHI
jgi:hypothetical protein